MISQIELCTEGRNIISPRTVSKSPSSDSPNPLVCHNSGKADSTGSCPAYSKKHVREEVGDDDLREQRKSANRRSAYQSRLRKKLLIEELQGKVSDFEEKLGSLHDDNKTLRLRLESAMTENRRLRYVQQDSLMTGNTGVGMHMTGVYSNTGSLGMSGASISAFLASKVAGVGFDPSTCSF